ncbi:hypothetical protein HPB50_006906 [Hyalomma asiaticum]|uniref:Uncharacterized protein n=1 Tax=Hyalomma asiaticum TaxID=266040 RepID=A0ACB7RHN7_HYAAI|nr:hypothetical protein HPB50_006906 [Hyalomma asiaticum]
MLVYTLNPHIADKLIGEFAVPSSVGPVPMFGYLRVDTQSSSYGVVTVPAPIMKPLFVRAFTGLKARSCTSADWAPLISEAQVRLLRCPADPGAALQENCTRLQSVRLCWASTRHLSRPQTTPLRICGNAVPVTDGCRAPHDCMPRCALCAAPHVTGDRHCKERYRVPPPKPPTPPPLAPGTQNGGQPSATNPIPPPHSGAWAIGSSLRSPTPDEPEVKRLAAGQAVPAPAKPNQPTSSWSNRVRKGPQVSGSDGATFASPPSMIPQPTPPAPSSITCEKIAFRQLQARVPEAVDSAPSQRRDTAVLLAPIEARLSSLEARMASIVTTIEDRLAAAHQTVFNRIPSIIASQSPEVALTTRRAKPKHISNSEEHRPLSEVTKVDEQSGNMKATSYLCTGSSSGVPTNSFAPLEAPQKFSSHDGGHQP